MTDKTLLQPDPVTVSPQGGCMTIADNPTKMAQEPRMLERRVSNNRTDLNNDQQMNYLLAWFQHWSDLQKEDFVPIMAEKMSSKYTHLNGLTEDMKAMKCDGPDG